MRNNADQERTKVLHDILNRQRNYELARVRQFRHDQAQDAPDSVGDELDVARSDLDTELHVTLIGLSEERLKAINDAFRRLEGGEYGICAECGEEIPIERLRVLPFTICCVDCQRKRETGRPIGAITEEYSARWTAPNEVNESFEGGDLLTQPEEDLSVHGVTPFGPEEGEFEQLPPTPTARRRGRVRQKKPPED